MRFLDDNLAVGSAKDPATDGGVFAFGVLAHDIKIDVAGVPSCERTGHAGHEPHRAQIDILIEFAAELDHGSPKRDVIGHFFGPTDRTKEDRVVAPDQILPIVRKHLVVLQVVVAGGEIKIVKLKREAVVSRGSLKSAQSFGNDFLADAVPWDHGDPVPATIFVAAFFYGMGHRTLFSN